MPGQRSDGGRQKVPTSKRIYNYLLQHNYLPKDSDDHKL